MSTYDLSVDDGSFYCHSFEADPFSDPFTPFSDSALDILQTLSDYQNTQTLVEEQPHSLEQSSSNLVSSSPPSFQLESLNLYQATHLSSVENDPNLGNVLEDFLVLENLLAESEQCLVGSEQNACDTQVSQQAFAPHSCSGGAENVAEYMQSSYSSNSFDGQPGFVFRPCFDPLLESPNFQTQEASLSSPESSYLTSHMKRVSSTEDMQNIEIARDPQESSAMEIAKKFKMTRYTAEERKERISKYRSRKAQRNFNKTIKYACRKTVADRRPRIGGRFVRYGQAGETHRPACSTREEDEDDLWI
ncbi:PREDICTED: zinc finger protein CONSTANS-LIKE 1-like [Fragaria vesca subsp. vesca]|uniref:zinc finger protein CONSTANS-LIKE 1-like n=1 Tax=Fragaria vesca subsp. vesca TaxID=101020 RepID=UPI0002C322FE|nr:PREDICTED: zinc finger protein CONSTANS-LIKE 1-like [Fragaria vesca subsp. vesca]